MVKLKKDKVFLGTNVAKIAAPILSYPNKPVNT